MIRVNEDYIIEVDALNYIPKIDKHKVSKDKDGKERAVFDTIGYCSTLAGALCKIKEDMYKDCIAEKEISLYEALNELKRVNKEFENIFNRVLEQGNE